MLNEYQKSLVTRICSFCNISFNSLKRVYLDGEKVPFKIVCTKRPREKFAKLHEIFYLKF